MNFDNGILSRHFLFSDVNLYIYFVIINDMFARYTRPLIQGDSYFYLNKTELHISVNRVFFLLKLYLKGLKSPYAQNDCLNKNYGLSPPESMSC